MLTIGTPLAATYTEGDKTVTDYTGVVIRVDNTHPTLTVTVLFHGGRQATYTTDTNGNSVDTGMQPTPCPGPHDPIELPSIRTLAHH